MEVKRPETKQRITYFLSDGNGRVKIGWTDNFKARRRQLEQQMHMRLTVMGLLNEVGHCDFDRDGSTTERLIHSCFKHLRIGKTEMFTLTDGLRSFISVNCPSAGMSVDQNYLHPDRTMTPYEWYRWNRFRRGIAWEKRVLMEWLDQFGGIEKCIANPVRPAETIDVHPRALANVLIKCPQLSSLSRLVASVTLFGRSGDKYDRRSINACA